MGPEEKTYKSLQDALKEPAKVHRLNLSSQNLTEIPGEVSRLPNLYHLNLSTNQVRQLSPALFGLTHLEELHLQSNLLTEIPAEIAKLKNLRELYLKTNLLKSLPLDALVKLKKLEILMIKDNPLPANLVAELRTRLSKVQIF